MRLLMRHQQSPGKSPTSKILDRTFSCGPHTCATHAACTPASVCSKADLVSAKLGRCKGVHAGTSGWQCSACATAALQCMQCRFVDSAAKNNACMQTIMQSLSGQCTWCPSTVMNTFDVLVVSGGKLRVQPTPHAERWSVPAGCHDWLVWLQQEAVWHHEQSTPRSCRCAQAKVRRTRSYSHPGSQ